MKNAINWKVFYVTPMMLLLLLAFASTTWAGESHSNHKIVFQVNSADDATRNMALGNAAHVREEFGAENVHVVVVAYGPGLKMLTQKSAQADMIESLMMQDIDFNACGNTMKKMTKKSGKEPVLVSGVEVVPSGVGRIVELQEQGYVYIRP